MRSDDFQLEERVEQNIQRKRKFLRWLPFSINLTLFMLYFILVLVSVTDLIGPQFYFGSLFRDVARGYRPEILWLPIVFWFLTICIHLASVLIEDGHLNKQIAARAQAEEKQIIEAILQRLDQAEKRKHDTSHLEDNSMTRSDASIAFSQVESEEHARHATL